MIIKNQRSAHETLQFIMTCGPLEEFAIVLLVPKRIHRFLTSKKENILCATPDYLFQLLWFLRCHINTRFGISIDIRGVDYPSQERRFGVVYNLPSIQYNSCICIRIGVDEITSASSVISISPSAGWWEREVWDTSGLHSCNYHDLRRILTDYGFEGHPLRKDFPLSGYAEVRYDDSEKRVVSEPVEMT